MYVGFSKRFSPAANDYDWAILRRLNNFLGFVKSVVLRVFSNICQDECGGGKSCRNCDWFSAGSSDWPEVEDENEALLPPSFRPLPPPLPPPPAPPAPSSEDEARATSSHRKLCWDFEEDDTLCLNGGSCFAIELHNGMRRSACSCTPNWTGERCEMRYIDPILWDEPDEYVYRSAGVSVEVCVLIVFAFAFLTAVYVYMRQHRSSSSSSSLQHLTQKTTDSFDRRQVEPPLQLDAVVFTAAAAATAATAGSVDRVVVPPNQSASLSSSDPVTYLKSSQVSCPRAAFTSRREKISDSPEVQSAHAYNGNCAASAQTTEATLVCSDQSNVFQ